MFQAPTIIGTSPSGRVASSAAIQFVLAPYGGGTATTAVDYTVDVNGTTVFVGTIDPTAAVVTSDTWTFDVGLSGVVWPSLPCYATFAFVTHSGGDTSAPAYATFEVVEGSTVTITSPADGATVRTMPLTVAWEVTGPFAVAYQRLRVISAGDSSQTVFDSAENGGIGTSRRSYDVPLGAAAIANGESYVVVLDVTSGAGIQTRATARFSTEWQAPAEPSASVAYDRDRMAAIITVAENGGDIPTASLMVVRVDQYGGRYVIADSVASGSTVTDVLPPLGVDYSYEVSAIAATGAAATLTVPARFESTAWAFNYGARAEGVLAMMGNPSASRDLDQGGEAYHMADGGAGGGYPVWYGTSERDQNGTVSFEDVGPSDADRLFAIVEQHPTLWIRDPVGRRHYAQVKPRENYGKGDLWKVSVTWQRLRFVEV